MALPVAHAAAGYLVHRVGRGMFDGRERRSDWRRAVGCMIVGNLPDADFLVGFVLGQPGMLHRGVSHTVVAAVVFAVVVGVWARWYRHERFTPWAVLFGAAYLSHLVLDWLTIDTRPPVGAQFLWPFSSEYFTAPVPIFTEIHIDGRTRAGFLGSVVTGRTVLVLLREVVIATVVLGAWLLLERARVPERPAILAPEEREGDLA